MLEKIITEIMENHRGKALGIIIGFVVGLFLINFGFWKTIILSIFIFAGYVIGKRIDNNDDIRDMINKIIYKEKKPR